MFSTKRNTKKIKVYSKNLTRLSVYNDEDKIIRQMVIM